MGRRRVASDPHISQGASDRGRRSGAIDLDDRHDEEMLEFPHIENRRVRIVRGDARAAAVQLVEIRPRAEPERMVLLIRRIGICVPRLGVGARITTLAVRTPRCVRDLQIDRRHHQFPRRVPIGASALNARAPRPIRAMRNSFAATGP